MRAGRFIAFEGGEGAGKSTQARMLAEELRARAVEVVLTREPGGTPGAEAIRALLLGQDTSDWGPSAEALLFAAARADHVERLIRPMLEAGAWVICDRFVDSSRAYQVGAATPRDEDIVALHRIGSGGLLPDLTLLIEISPEGAALRLAARDGGIADRIGGRGAAYHAGVASRYAVLAEAEPWRFVRIEGAGEPEAVHARVLAALAPMLDGGR